MKFENYIDEVIKNFNDKRIIEKAKNFFLKY